MPSVTPAAPEAADVDDSALPRYREATEGKASHSVKGGTWWLEDGIRQVVCSSVRSAARSGWRAGGSCSKVDSSVGCIARWSSAPRRAADEAACVDEAGRTTPAGQP